MRRDGEDLRILYLGNRWNYLGKSEEESNIGVFRDYLEKVFLLKIKM